jgi:hypothetical protein
MVNSSAFDLLVFLDQKLYNLNINSRQRISGL